MVGIQPTASTFILTPDRCASIQLNCRSISHTCTGNSIRRGESKNKLKFLYLSEFITLFRLLLLRVTYIELQSNSNNFHGLKI